MVLVDQALFSPYKKHFLYVYGEGCNMDYIPLSDNASRQYIDSVTVFEETARAAAHAQQYRGGMYRKMEGSYEYLVKTQADHRQTRLGRRSPTRKLASEDRACFEARCGKTPPR
ncbi:hypothetical protein F2P45_01115 [Massilia sp. CCM 8733]|uniref:Uncharacterized protein n=1 Tax=Massilia mucilaginosa TaxID=2609282 RepID=A0ABX0NLF6_9BURK|nr:hypothetical protein [Massilia mucilaginosa]NHZ87640.1 hypothetical protein [Massilia mucilaginosa]